MKGRLSHMSISVVELFAGIGAFRQALKNQNMPHEVVAFSEIDKYAIESYRAVHNDYTTPNLGDITKIEELPECDLLTYGFPCQDLSIAGHGKGIKEGTRSGLLLEVERLLDISSQKGNLPKYLILENVKALVQKKHRKDFDVWLEKLESLGYSNYWQVLNAKDYGIPQNRERVFVISILGEHNPYEFPEKQELKLRLRDLLDDEVPENYYLQDEKVKAFLEKYKEKIGNSRVKSGLYGVGEISTGGQRARVYNPKILINEGINNPLKGLTPAGWHFEQNVYSLDSKLCRTVKAGGGSGNIPKILIDKDVSNCIIANYHKGSDLKGYFEKSRKQLVTDCSLRIRRLTPNECWRLMGFSDEAYQKARIALNNKFYKGKDRANSQQYKQAGNSIVVNVLENIFINLYKKEEED